MGGGLDHLDGLTERLVGDLDRRADSPLESRFCPGLPVLEQLVTGQLDLSARERVDGHLDECLSCLNRFVELRDLLQGAAASAPPSPRLAQRLEQLLGEAPGRPWGARILDVIRRALTFRIPAWAVAGAVAALLVAWIAVHRLQGPGPGVEWPFTDPTTSERLKPAHSESTRTITGVVSSTRDATSNGVEAYIVSLKDASGAMYVLFTWGRPTVRPGDAVEIDGVFTGGAQSTGPPVYQGVVTQLRRAR
jgi:hypothetical protein